MALTQVPASMQEPSAQYTGFKNRIINGNMLIAQRGTSVTGMAIDTYGACDRYKQWAASGGETGRSTWAQVTDVPANQGFTYSTKISVTTAQASPAAGHCYKFVQRVEANNILDFGFGESSGQQITFSFWAKVENRTGIYSLNLDATETGPTYKRQLREFTFTTSWQKFTATFTADSTNKLIPGTGIGMEIGIVLMAGSNFSGSGNPTTDTWVSVTSPSTCNSANQVNFFDSTSNALYITGVQLEKGSTATSFDYRPYGTELALCQRYFYQMAKGTNIALGISACTGTTDLRGCLWFPVSMRIAPSMTSVSGTNYYRIYTGAANVSFTNIATDLPGTQSWGFGSATGLSGVTQGQSGILLTNDAGSSLSFSAEL